tara:strand:+ start:262 stop:399 length:138 start_codon:yes stop_codon:yes gene_type:complete
MNNREGTTEKEQQRRNNREGIEEEKQKGTIKKAGLNCIFVVLCGN